MAFLHPATNLTLHSDMDIAAVCSCGAGAVVQKISRCVIRMLRRLGYLEVGIDAAAATVYDPDVPGRAAQGRRYAIFTAI